MVTIKDTFSKKNYKGRKNTAPRNKISEINSGKCHATADKKVYKKEFIADIIKRVNETKIVEPNIVSVATTIANEWPMTPNKKFQCRDARRKAVIKEITASKKNALAYLKKAGILDENGELSPIYR